MRRPAEKGADWRITATSVAGIVSVLLVAAGLFYTNQANREQQKLGIQQQELNLQGQIADRFTAAVGQIGQEDTKDGSKLSIRLGGIYALQRLMTDSPPYEPAIVAVLGTFVRTHTPPAPAPELKFLPRVPQAPSVEVKPVEPDVAASVAVLAARPEPHRFRLELSGVVLGLQGARLDGAYFAQEHFEYVDFTTAGLAGADLSSADLQQSSFRNARLSGAILRDAILYEADLRFAALDNTDLSAAMLRYANLQGVDLRGARLLGADARYANFTKANLRGAQLAGTDLSGADLSGAEGVTRAQLGEAVLSPETKLPAVVG